MHEIENKIDSNGAGHLGKQRDALSGFGNYGSWNSYEDDDEFTKMHKEGKTNAKWDQLQYMNLISFVCKGV